jgi:hypothetical protein
MLWIGLDVVVATKGDILWERQREDVRGGRGGGGLAAVTHAGRQGAQGSDLGITVLVLRGAGPWILAPVELFEDLVQHGIGEERGRGRRSEREGERE